MRQLYLCGVDDKHWNLKDSLQAGAVSAVKWGGNVSDCFQIQQGVRQGGVLSADQYKVYVDPVLHIYNNNKKKFRSFKSKENIHKKEVWSYRGFSY